MTLQTKPKKYENQNYSKRKIKKAAYTGKKITKKQKSICVVTMASERFKDREARQVLASVPADRCQEAQTSECGPGIICYI